MKLIINKRKGERPHTTTTNPHQQLDQHPPKEIVHRLHEYILTYQSITEAHSLISTPGTPAFFLSACRHKGFGEGFIVDNEFVHIHPLPDGSLHLALPEDEGADLVQYQWGEPHVLAGKHGLPKTIFMLYAPRDEEELAVAKQFVDISYKFAKEKCGLLK